MTYAYKGIKQRLEILKGNRSLKEFSEILEVPYSTLHYYFNGREPSLSFLLKVCIKLNVNEEWLILGKGNIYKEEPNDDGLTLEHIIEFIKYKWKKFGKKEKHWFEVELKRMFPDLEVFLLQRNKGSVP